MKKIYLLFIVMFAAVVSNAQTINATVSVDMTGFTVPSAGVHIAGSFNGWNPAGTALTDNGGNIWSAVLVVTPGNDIEYKFINGDAWGADESAPAECTSGGGNRIFTAESSDMTIPVVPFDGCPAFTPHKTIKLSIDMGTAVISADSIHIAGNFNGWSSGGTVVLLKSGTKYEITAQILSSILVIQYKFLNGKNWGTEENPIGTCANSSKNRLYNIATIPSGTAPTYMFGTCDLSASSGINAGENMFNFNVYPSITSDFIEVNFNSVNKNDITFSIYNTNGSLITRETMSRTQNTIEKKFDVSGLASGVYLLEVMNNGSRNTERFIVR
jgi:hypothetical protein